MAIKSCNGFTPIREDGMMLQVWTEGKSKKYWSSAEVVEDEECINNENESKPGQYVLYIPHGVLVVLPGDTVHAGGFCFGRKLPCPSTDPGNEVLLQNHCLHFIFCCSHLAFQDSNGEASITVAGEDEPPCLKDYLPDEEVMESLFKSVLDHHPNFIPIAVYKQPTRLYRKRKKYTKGFADNCKKGLSDFHLSLSLSSGKRHSINISLFVYI